MNSNKLRTIVAAAIFVVLSVGLIAGVSMGTLSGFGWETFSALCPLGALATMIATKTVVPRAVVSIVIMAVLVLAVGRAFCGWVCPVPLLDRVRGFFRSPKKRTALEQAKRSEMLGIAKSELGEAAASPERAKRVEGSPTAADGAYSHDCGSCSSCKGVRAKLDSRHYVLGGALLSTAIFGFPVFCLVCPIGLTIASVIALYRFVGFNELTLSLVVFPAVIVLELVVLRKWCHRFCPVGALLSLISSFGSKMTRPRVDHDRCLRAESEPCTACASVCPEHIDPVADLGRRPLSECTRCGRCADACPHDAISFTKRGLALRRNESARKAADA